MITRSEANDRFMTRLPFTRNANGPSPSGNKRGAARRFVYPFFPKNCRLAALDAAIPEAVPALRTPILNEDAQQTDHDPAKIRT
jgi:hypothetical protein